VRAENAELKARLERQLALAQGLGATQQLGAILRTSLDHAVALSGADSGAVYLLELERQRLELACHSGLSAAYVHQRRWVSLDNPVVAAGLAGDHSFLDLEHDAATQDEHDRAEGITAAVVLPVTHGERVLGGLYLCSHGLARLDAGAAGALRLLASQLGAAISRARAAESQAKLAAAVEASLASVGLADLDGTCSYVNPALAATWGYPDPEAMVGSSVLDWWAVPADAARVLAQVLEQGSLTSELLARRADGSTFPAVGTACVVRDGSGEATHVVGSFIDVSDLRQAQLAMREARLTSAINGLLCRALEGGDDDDMGRSCVQVAMDLTGATLGLLGTIGRGGALANTYTAGLEDWAGEDGANFADLVPGAATMKGLWGHAFERGEPFLSNQPADHPSSVGLPEGHPPIDSVLITPLMSDGLCRAVLGLANRPGGFSEDHATVASTLGPAILQVLEHRRSERSRRESERLLREQDLHLRQAQKLEAIGRLAGGVAHDFNNLLAVITLFGQAVQGGLDPDSEAFEDTSAILETAERGAQLTRQLLAFGRRAVLKPVHRQAGALVLEMESMLQRLMGDNITVAVDAVAASGWVHVDPGELGQVILNLAVNARDAMPEGGRLAVSVIDHVLLDAQAAPDLPAGEYVELRVEDDGVGMGPQQLEHIFEPFYTTKELGKGTGLGLAMVYGIVRQTGGTVVVESQPGQGSTFRIYLPRVPSEAERERPAAPRSRSGEGRETVLLAEDDDLVRRGMARFLRRNGYSVLEAANAGEALLIAEQHVGVIHALVSDVDMPRISGPRLARRLLLARPRLLVLFVSGHGGDGILGDVPSIEGAQLLSKPFSADELTGALRELLDRH